MSADPRRVASPSGTGGTARGSEQESARTKTLARVSRSKCGSEGAVRLDAAAPSRASSMLARLDRARHRIPFWWWLTYDALVGLVIVAGIRPSDPAYWLGLGVLAIAVAIDAVEFIVKRPSAREKLDA